VTPCHWRSEMAAAKQGIIALLHAEISSALTSMGALVFAAARFSMRETRRDARNSSRPAPATLTGMDCGGAGKPAVTNETSRAGSITMRDLALLEQRLDTSIEAAKWEIIALLRAAEVANALAAQRRTLILTTLGGMVGSVAVLLAAGRL